MKRFLLAILTLLLLPLATFAQERTYSIEIDAKSLAPVQTDPISGVMIDKINPDRSQRPCARIKIHINRMSRDEISELSVKAIGGNVEVMRQIVARQGNGLILELTAKDPTRFYLHHPKYGDSNEVSLALEGDKEYRLEAQLNYMHGVVISSNTINAEVYLDNEFKGRIGDNYTLSISEVLPGAHKIRIQDGSLKTETDVEVSSSSFSFRVELNQALARPQYVVFIIEPKEAAITIDGKAIMPNAEGVAQIMLSNGSYKYSISAKEYYAESGEFIVNGAKVVKNISLRPAFGYLSIPATGDLADAGVYIDNSLIGKTPITNYKVANGTHNVRIIKELYKVSEGTVVISEGEKTEYAPSLVADFANVTLSAGDGCEIFVNNEKMGLSPWSGRLATGAYIFEARKSGHRASSISKSISATQQPQSFTIPAPKPILGSLNVTSLPIMAQVFIDDKLVGETPLMVDVMVGKHTVSARKQGFSNTQKEVTITEGQTTDINITLYKSVGCQMKYTSSNGKVVNPKADAFDANIVSNTYINGQGVIVFDRPIKEIEYGAFEKSKSLTSITIPNGVKEIGSWAFYGCSALTSITIPNGVKVIGSGAFKGCSSLTSITIPDSVTEIGAYAFYNCSSLIRVYCKPITPPVEGSDIFYANASGRKIYVPRASVKAYKSSWNGYADAIVGETSSSENIQSNSK